MPGKLEIQQKRWRQLTELLERAERGGISSFSVEEVTQLGRLYRQTAIDLSRARTDAEDPQLIQYLNRLVARAHGQVYITQRVDLRAFLDFLWSGFPRAIRRHWIPLLASFLLFYGTALASFIAVLRDPDLAYSLFDENVVEYENLRLEQQKGEYKGNFTFPLEASPAVAARIITNNIRVACMTFALGTLFCLPCVLLLIYNGRMLGTLSGVVWLHHYFLDFYSLILTHGVLELTAICIAGAGGLMLGWALIAPGQMPRRDALKSAGGQAIVLLGGACVMLVLAGIIEAYITPHRPAPERWAVALITGILMLLYLGLAGRRSRSASHAGR